MRHKCASDSLLPISKSAVPARSARPNAIKVCCKSQHVKRGRNGKKRQGNQGQRNRGEGAGGLGMAVLTSWERDGSLLPFEWNIQV